MTKRSRVVGFGLAALLVIVGAISPIIASGELGQLLALVLISLGLVLATALVFLEVGLSEDRELARQRRPRRRPRARRPRRRLERLRGQPRRLNREDD